MRFPLAEMSGKKRFSKLATDIYGTKGKE